MRSSVHQTRDNSAKCQQTLVNVASFSGSLVHGSGPAYLTEMISMHRPARSLRSADQKLLFQPCAKMKTYGDRAFAVAGPKYWNDLPLELRAIGKYDTFKSHLKTHLFNLAF